MKKEKYILSQSEPHELYYKVNKNLIYCDVYPILNDSIIVKEYILDNNKKWIHKNNNGEIIEVCCFKKNKKWKFLKQPMMIKIPCS